MKPYKFNNKFLKPLSTKIKAEGTTEFQANKKKHYRVSTEDLLKQFYIENQSPHKINFTSQTLVDNVANRHIALSLEI